MTEAKVCFGCGGYKPADEFEQVNGIELCRGCREETVDA